MRKAVTNQQALDAVNLLNVLDAVTYSIDEDESSGKMDGIDAIFALAMTRFMINGLTNGLYHYDA